MISLDGKCAGCEDFLEFYYLGDYSAHYSVDNLQENGSNVLFEDEVGTARMLVNEDPGYKVISSSVVLAAMANSDSLNYKPYLISEFVNYFIGYNPVTDLQENISQLFESFIYPNPFSVEAAISYSVPTTGIVKIEVFNLNGQPVRLLENSIHQPGSYETHWDGTGTSGELQPNGYYFIRIYTKGSSVTDKVILQR